MFNSWQNALEKQNDGMTTKVQLEDSEKIKSAWFINKRLVIIWAIFLLILFAIIFKFIKVPFIFKVAEIGLGIYLGVKLYKIYKFSKSENMLKAVGGVVLNSLYRCKYISTPRTKIKIVVRKDNKKNVTCAITGCTLKESNLFADCLEEVFTKTENQRYIIAKLTNNLKEINQYYNVPEVLSIKKEYAEIFSKYWGQKIGEHDLIYTKTADGRRKLLKARMKNISYKDKILKKQELSFK